MTKIIFITLYLIGWFVNAFQMITADTTEEIMSRFDSIDPGLIHGVIYVLALVICLFWPYFSIKAFCIAFKQLVQEVYGGEEKSNDPNMEITDDLH